MDKAFLAGVISMASVLFLAVTCGKGHKKGKARARTSRTASKSRAVTSATSKHSRISKTSTFRHRKKRKVSKRRKVKPRRGSKASASHVKSMSSEIIAEAGFTRKSPRGQLRRLITVNRPSYYCKMYALRTANPKHFAQPSRWEYVKMPEAEKGGNDTSCLLFLREVVKKDKRRIILLSKEQGVDRLFAIPELASANCGEFTLHCQDTASRTDTSALSAQRISIFTHSGKKCGVQFFNYSHFVNLYKEDSYTIFLAELLSEMVTPEKRSALVVADSEADVARLAFCLLVLFRCLIGNETLLMRQNFLQHALDRSIQISSGKFRLSDLQDSLISLLDCCCFKEKLMQARKGYIPGKKVTKKREIVKKWNSKLAAHNCKVCANEVVAPEPPISKSKVGHR